MKNFKSNTPKTQINYELTLKAHIQDTLKMPNSWSPIKADFEKISQIRNEINFESISDTNFLNKPQMQPTKDQMKLYIKYCFLLKNVFCHSENQIKNFKVIWISGFNQKVIKSTSHLFELINVLFNFFVLHFNEANNTYNTMEHADDLQHAIDKCEIAKWAIEELIEITNCVSSLPKNALEFTKDGLDFFNSACDGLYALIVLKLSQPFLQIDEMGENEVVTLYNDVASSFFKCYQILIKNSKLKKAMKDCVQFVFSTHFFYSFKTCKIMVELMAKRQSVKPYMGWIGKECSYLQQIKALEKDLKKRKNVLERDNILKEMKEMKYKETLKKRMKKINTIFKCEIPSYETLNCILPQTKKLLAEEPDGIRDFPDNILHFLALNPKTMKQIGTMIESTVKKNRTEVETIFLNFEDSILNLKSSYDFDTVFKLLDVSESLPQRQEFLKKQNTFISNGGFKQMSELNKETEKQIFDIELNSMLILKKFSENKDLVKSHQKELSAIQTLHTAYKEKRNQFNENKNQFEKTQNNQLDILEDRTLAVQEGGDTLDSFLEENKTVMKAIKNNMNILEESIKQYLKPCYVQLMKIFSNVDEQLIVKNIFMNLQSLDTIKTEILESIEEKIDNFYSTLEKFNSTILDNIRKLCVELFDKDIPSATSDIDITLVSEQLDSFLTYLKVGTFLNRDINKIQNGCQKILENLNLPL